MAANDNVIASAAVEITGDWSALEQALSTAETSAKLSADTIAAAFEQAANASELAGGQLTLFTSALEGLQGQGVSFSDALQSMADSSKTLGQEVADAAQAILDQYTPATQSAADASHGAAAGMDEVANSAHHAGEAAHEAEGGIAGMSEALIAVGEALVITEGLHEFLSEALNAFGVTQQLATSLTILTGSGEQAETEISKLADMSVNLAVKWSDLQGQARLMASAFGSIEDGRLNDVLTQAANAAAATGRSFDAVSNALLRIELTGAVTNRQLIQLGLSWQDLATAAGKSVEDTQAALKKGGQDAEADVQNVLDAISQKYGAAAAAQAAGIKGQFTVLSNETEFLFEAIGQALAPVITSILGMVQNVVVAAKGMVDAFNGLPEALKDFVVIVGLAAAAVVPLTAAAGGFGLALVGINAIIPAFTGLMETLGVATAAEATAQTAAAAATVAHGTAAAEAAGGITALAGAEEAAATSAGLAATGIGSLIAVMIPGLLMAATATAGQINDLKAKWTDLFTEIQHHRIVDAIEAGNSMAQLNAMGDSAKAVGEALSSAGVKGATTFEQISNSINPPIIALTDMGAKMSDIQKALQGIEHDGVTAWQAMKNGATLPELADVGFDIDKIRTALNNLKLEAPTTFKALDLGIKIVVDGFRGITGGAQDVVDKQRDLQQEVLRTKTNYDSLSAALKAGETDLKGQAITQAAVNLAYKDYEAALAKVTPAIKYQADSVADLMDKQDKATALWKTAAASAKGLSDAIEDGSNKYKGWTVTADDLARAQTAVNKTFTDSHPAFTQALADIGASISKLNEFTDAERGLIGQLVNSKITMQQFTDQMRALAQAGSDSAVVFTRAGQSTVAYTEGVKQASTAGGSLVESLTGVAAAAQQSIPVLDGSGKVIRDTIVPAFTQGDQVGQAFKGTISGLGPATEIMAGMVVKSGVPAAYQLGDSFTSAALAAKSLADQQPVLTLKLHDSESAARSTGDQVTYYDKSGRAAFLTTDTLTQATYNATKALGTVRTDGFGPATSAADDYSASTQAVLDDCVSLVDESSNVVTALSDQASGWSAVAEAAYNASDAIQQAMIAEEAAASGSGGSGGGGGHGGKGGGQLSALATLLSYGQSPESFLGGNSSQSSIDQTAQGLANAFNVVIQTMDGQFKPAAWSWAKALDSLSGGTLNQDLAARLAATTTTIHTAATQTNTAAVTASTAAQQSYTNGILTSTYEANKAAAAAAQHAAALAGSTSAVAALGAAAAASSTAMVQASATVSQAAIVAAQVSNAVAASEGMVGVVNNTPGPVSLQNLPAYGGGQVLGGNDSALRTASMFVNQPSQPLNMPITVTGNQVIGDANIRTLADMIQQSTIATLRRAGYKL